MSLVEIKNLTHIYNPDSSFEKRALDKVSLKIEKGEFIGLIGHTGSGKSTLIQHLNGLIKPTEGEIYIDGKNISSKEVKLQEIRQSVGLVFQYPEYQLFEETIEKDIAFGPKNQGFDSEEVTKRVKEAMDSVGLDYETLKDRSPFELSGGQKRRVAIAGVLAMQPKLLILDEPTAGLDPAGRDEILGEIREIFSKREITIIVVSHSMEDMAEIADRIVVMNRGKLIMDATPREIFKREDELVSIGLGVPQITSFMRAFKRCSPSIDDDVITIEEAKMELIKYLRGKNA
ncbi:energy-coupling factor transport system ATP-binding protein [Peptoniphilus asaccharolyticus DSM 20463]|uniref:Energy-coupling factor transporter ATP-binding protein EcfA2 n=1 Tax=Peptoniphilus asaccharolyticus DSM 20463 TaxID=573058 RepID=A0A1W1VCD2_PEPAS|nr:energy-coupling factor transporter ATPase [Peptoniphilus asaccharolyticus]MBL7575604.1 energy-coupling factor transporter ATPase [Peptoniphilus asaccharolyticus]SMB91022.1 energy-coupling factor transport system ATP-binding protein [Peptoniphilus asaccharolyticus DSM 20463]